MTFRLIVILALCLPASAHALLPPDIIISVGSNLLQILGVIALAITAIYSAVFVAVRQGFFVLKKHILIFLLMGNLAAGGVLYWYISKQEQAFLSLNQRLEQLQIDKAVLESQSVGVSQAATTTPVLACGDGEEMGQCVPGKDFHSDTFVVRGEGVILEFDINRVEVEPHSGVFAQYMYLSGSVNGMQVNEYSKALSTSTVPVPDAFLQNYTVTQSDDLSPRATYVMTILVQEVPVTISISSIGSDFVSRNELAYTRTHGSGFAAVTVAGKTEQVYAYVEKSYSSDVHKSIFFPGYEAVDSKTMQFVLWDDAGQFYLFDSTEVKQALPQYRSHTWLLTKDANGKARKSFSGSYREITTGIKLAWELSFPEFDSALMQLTAEDLYKSENGRIRAKVAGVISDRNGERTVRGVAHIID